MHVYGTSDLQRLLGVSAASVRTLIRTGQVRPRKGARGRFQFSFQDLIVLRTARSLTHAHVPARRINRCLRQLRAALPADMPLSGLSITAVGDQVVVREGQQRWNTESGQYLLALDVTVESGEVRLVTRDMKATGRSGEATSAAGQAGGASSDVGRSGEVSSAAPKSAPGEPVQTDEAVQTDDDASGHYDRGCELEAKDAVAAIAAYQRCLAANRGHSDARLNCGRLLHLAGRLAEAERLYRESEMIDAALLFNLGVLLEDLGRKSEATLAYTQALELDPDFADAHFNLARLHELAGNRRESFRHLLAYKRASE